MNDMIERLSDDLTPSPKLTPLPLVTTVWLVASALYVVVLTALLGPFRPGFGAQLIDSPRFLLEMLMGAGAVVCFAVAAFRLAVPGRQTKTVVRLGAACAIGWLSQFVIGFAYPVLEPSMLGKRDHCAFEAYLYSVPPVLVALWLQSRRYALSPMKAAFSAALAASLIPAIVMQVACMYEPEHILKFHVLPIGILSTAVGICMFVYLKATSSDAKSPE